MLKKLMRELGFMLIANAALFTPVLACADDGSSMGGYIGAPVGAIATGCVLVSMSRTKNHATKADKYTKGKLELKDKNDVYIRTTTEQVTIRDKR